MGKSLNSRQDITSILRLRKARATHAASYRDGNVPADNDNDEAPTPMRVNVGQQQLLYLNSDKGRERSEYLDNLILKKDQPKKEPTLTAGDVWRASLPVGRRVKYGLSHAQYEDRKPERAAERQEFDAMIVALVPTLQDVCLMSDIVERLPAALVQSMGKSLPVLLSKALQAVGVGRRKMTNASKRTGYIMRCAAEYDAMSIKALMAHRNAHTFTAPGAPVPFGEARFGRGKSTRGRGQPAKNWTDAERRERDATRHAAKVAAMTPTELDAHREQHRLAQNARRRAKRAAWPEAERKERQLGELARRRAKRSAMTPDQREAVRERERRRNRRRDRAGYHRQRNANRRNGHAEKLAAMTPDEQVIERARRRKVHSQWRANRTPEQVQAEKDRHARYNRDLPIWPETPQTRPWSPLPRREALTIGEF